MRACSLLMRRRLVGIIFGGLGVTIAKVFRLAQVGCSGLIERV